MIDWELPTEWVFSDLFSDSMVQFLIGYKPNILQTANDILYAASTIQCRILLPRCYFYGDFTFNQTQEGRLRGVKFLASRAWGASLRAG